MCEVVYYGDNRRGGVKLPDWLLQKLFQRKTQAHGEANLGESLSGNWRSILKVLGQRIKFI